MQLYRTISRMYLLSEHRKLHNSTVVFTLKNTEGIHKKLIKVLLDWGSWGGKKVY